jgi:predicted metalloprotease with PDZ domain
MFYHLIHFPKKYVVTSTPPVPEATVPKKEEKRIEVRLLPKEKPQPVIDNLLPLKSDLPIPKPTYKTDERVCDGKDKSYKGVGFIWNPQTNVITHIPEFYPAYQAGMRKGDMVINPENPISNDRIHFFVVRSHAQLEFNVKVDKICFQDG